MTHFMANDATSLKGLEPGLVRTGDTCTCDLFTDRVLIACIGDPDEVDDDASVLVAGNYAWVILLTDESKIVEHVRLAKVVINLTLPRAKA